MGKESFEEGVSLVRQLVRLGVRPGDRLAVHSSYKAIGNVSGGPETVIEALMRSVGKDGILLMPIFVDHPVPLYDPKETRSDCGIITELFRRRPDVTVSYHPTHAVAVWGARAEWMARAHEESRTALGMDSPFDRLAQAGGKVLLLGVGHDRNSMVHVGEAHSRVRYLNVFYSREFEGSHAIRMPDGSIQSVVIRECPGCSAHFHTVEEELRKHRAITDGFLGAARAQCMTGKDIIAAVQRLVARDPGALLCHNPACVVCPRARATCAP